jgi:hypothetical protein
MARSKYCPKHGDPEELPHMVSHCTCIDEPKFPINLIGELVAVRPNPPENTVRLPDWKRALNGTVLAVGPEVRSIESGDTVYFGAAVGMDSVLSGQTIRLLKEQDLDFIYEA